MGGGFRHIPFGIFSDRNYSFVLTKASAVDKCNKAGDVYGKMLVLTFEDNEDAMMNRILSLINTKEVLMQQ